MTTNDIDAIRKLTDAATPGPWKTGDRFGNRSLGSSVAVLAGNLPPVELDSHRNGRNDARFIAAARTLVPALCDEVELRLVQAADAINRAHHAEAKVAELTSALTQSRAQTATYANEIGSLKADLERMRAERDRLANEQAAMLGVVRAAERWRAQFSKPADTKLPRQGALIAAVDALPNDQEPCDTCSSTAGGCPECRTDGLTAETVNV